MSISFRLAPALLAGIIALVVFSSPARAQAYQCKPTETQAECHKRLKCGPYEELEECQKRLRAGGGGGNNSNRDDRGDRDRGDRDRGDRDRGDRDRGDRGDRSDRRDRGDRGDRDDGRSRGRRRGSRSRGGSSSRSFEANKIFGLGLELGVPIGLTGKYFVSDSNALDFGLGYVPRAYYYGRGRGVHLYADYLWHPVSLVSNDTLELPFYVGVGARYWDFDYCYQGLCDYGGSAFGLRIPLGIALDFNNVPLDIFFQLVPVIDFLYGDYYNRYRDRGHFGIDGSVGIRFWFK